ncbi:spermatogenesis-associated protein 2-like protein [Pelodytes ibericus]
MSSESLFVHYKSWLLTTYESGETAPCSDVKLLGLVKDHLLENPELHNTLQTDTFSLISSGLQMREDMGSSLQYLADAFQVFEQFALNLYFTPWRKEFQTIKTYSGHYVHILEAALPRDEIFQALRQLGYEPQEDGQVLSILSSPKPQNLSLSAFGFLAAQVECEILSSILSRAGPVFLTAADLIRERTNWGGEMACVESLKKLTLGAPTLVKGPDFKGVEMALHRAPPLYQSQFCDHCHERWSVHIKGSCRKVADTGTSSLSTSIPAGPKEARKTKANLVLHDCVFHDQSLERLCAGCRTLHSARCSVVKECKASGHHVHTLCPSEKQEVLKQEERNRYRMHSCLQPGHLPHYRCHSCQELHYINCNVVTQCRTQGHDAAMIMLEKDQRLWLLRSSMDLGPLGLDNNTQEPDGV